MKQVPISLSHDQVRRLRVRAQRLDPRQSATSVAQTVREIGGIQAQDAAAAALAVRARSSGLTAADVERARARERSIVRTWGMRGTLHLLPTEDLGWLLSLFGPVLIPADRRRRAELGIDEETSIRAVQLIRDQLASQGPRSRAELAERLAAHGIPTEGQAIVHLIYRAALEGVLCLGPDRDGDPTYVLLDDWIERGHTLPREDALAALARRYFDAYGPADLEDFAAWSGLPRGDARTGWQRIAGELVEVAIDDRPAWMPHTHVAWLDEPATSRPVVRLLPSFDTYLLGYRSRALIVAPEHARRIHPGGGMLHPALVVDGLASGTWRSKRRRDGVEVIVEPFEDLTPDAQTGLEAEVADLGRFLGVASALRLASPT